MNKILLLTSSILVSITASHANTTQNAPFKKVNNCDSDYYNGSFCSKKNIARYKNVLKTQKANFAQHYILLNIGNTDALELIALDTKSGMAYPLNYQYTGWENNQGATMKKPSFQYSISQPKVCLSGSQYDGDHPGTHETYSNIRQCFEIKKTEDGIGFEANYHDQIQYEYNEKTKTWKPYE